jgi:citrate lyase beta subunit
LVNLPALANAALSRLSGIIIGTVDLGADLMLPEVRFRHPINEWARALVVAVAGAAGVPAIDGMNLEFPVGRPDLNAEENRELVLERMRNNFEDTLRSIDYGLSGRWVGHPLQLLATLLAFRRTFTEETIQADVDRLTSFAQLMSGPSAAATDASGTLMDIATDRHLRMLLTRATAWGLLPVEKARALGLIDAREGRPESNDG